MKILQLSIFLISLLSLASCSEHTVTISDKEGNTYTAAITPRGSTEKFDTTKNILISRPRTLTGYTNEPYVYNKDWQLSDSSRLFGLFKREIHTGKVISTN